MSPDPSTPRRVAAWLGLAAHLATLPCYAASGLLAPAWAIAVLWLAWLALLALAVRAVRARSPWGLLVPAAAVALWWGGITAGELLLGWKG